MRRVIIFGNGGVGSHLVYLLTRLNKEQSLIDNEFIDEIVLVDDDIIEEKNLSRQLFSSHNVGDRKTEASSIYWNTEELPVRTLNIKIKEASELLIFDKERDLAVICTDNVASKLLIAQYFKRFLWVNCDKDYYEIKNVIHRQDFNVWGDGGYNTQQTFLANIMSAIHVAELIRTYRFESHVDLKVKISRSAEKFELLNTRNSQEVKGEKDE